MSALSSIGGSGCALRESHPDPSTDYILTSRLAIGSVRRTGWSLSQSKRILDILIALGVISTFAVPMLLIAACIRLTSKGPSILIQQRVGLNGRMFALFKFRSMESSAQCLGPGLTRAGDSRITPVGRWIRKFKLDELPQFYNILRGDMSVVGPRPKLPQYAEEANLGFRPGITGAATLAFRDEEDILAGIDPEDVETFYQSHIKPMKSLMDQRYMREASFVTDTKIVLLTFLTCLVPRIDPRRHIDIMKVPCRTDGCSGPCASKSTASERMCIIKAAAGEARNPTY